MLVFLDDSGDAGFKVGQGSSAYFVIALVIFDDDLEALDTQVKIRRLRRELKRPDNHEFRFNGCSHAFRQRFLEVVATCHFRYRAIVLNKQGVYGPQLRRSKESFYNYAIKMVLKHSKGTIKEAKLRFDSHGERSVRRALTNYLRRELNTPEFRTFTDLKFKDSAQDDLIQLADMVAGAIRKSFERSRPEDAHYREIIKGREDDVWSFC